MLADSDQLKELYKEWRDSERAIKHMREQQKEFMSRYAKSREVKVGLLSKVFRIQLRKDEDNVDELDSISTLCEELSRGGKLKG